MKHFVQDSFEDDLPDDEDVDKLFSQLEQFSPPADLVKRVMQAVSRLPLPQMLQPDTQHCWDDEEELLIHHEYKRPS
jgi:hypothetical protein